MTPLLLALLIPLSAAPRKPVIAFMPASSNVEDLANLGLLIEARASGILEASGKYSELHVKQVHAMADAEGLARETLSEPAAAERARVLVGADRVVTLNLKVEDDEKKLTLSGSILDGKKPVPFKLTVPDTWHEALDQGGAAIAKAMLAIDKAPLPKKLTGQPESKSQDALLQLGDCYSRVIRQPLGIEAPVTLFGEELDVAAAACQKAIQLDPTLRFGTASLALAQAIVGDDAEATKNISSLGDGDDVSAAYVLARFWLVTRYQSNEAGVAFLREVIKKHPAQLLPRAYLGEALAAMNEDAKAADAWREYLVLAPQTPYAQGRLSRALARTGKNDEAIAAAQKALEFAADSKDARLQLGSRQIDAKKFDDAIASLKPLADAADARAEPILRLGWAYWLKGEVDAAAKLFQQAITKSDGVGEWRTRGRALYNLAMVEAKRGKQDAAKKAYAQSLETGFRVTPVDPLLAAFAPEGASKPATVRRESSLFPADASGAIDANAKKPPAPAGLKPYGQK